MHSIEREIEFKHIDPPLTDQTEKATALMRLDQRLNLCDR